MMGAVLDLVLVAIVVAVAVGLALAVWSYVDTRNHYYREYMGRKRK